MTDQPVKPTEVQQASTALAPATAVEAGVWKRWFGWTRAQQVRRILIGAAILLGPLVLAVAAKCLGATHELGVEMAKLIYSWPVAAGVCVVVFILTFRDPLHHLLSGVRRFKAGGFEMEAEQHAFPRTDRDPRKGEITWEEWFFELGKKLSPIDQQVIGQVGVVQREAFNFWVRSWWFERTWGRIYGTQVALVESLIQYPDKDRMDLGLVRSFFDRHVELRRATDSGYDKFVESVGSVDTYFKHWLGFLESALLIQRQGDEVVRTELTGEFVAYMRGQGYMRNMRIW